MSRVLVFAFGSNLDVDQMTARVPGRLIEGRARLNDHRLVFAGYSDRWRGAVASVIPATGHSTPGVLYSLDSLSLSVLDGYEGKMYSRRTLHVYAKGTSVLAEAYVQRRGAELGAPSARYVARIMGGYRAWKFDVRKLTRAIVFSAYGPDAIAGLENDVPCEVPNALRRLPPASPRPPASRSSGRTYSNFVAPRVPTRIHEALDLESIHTSGRDFFRRERVRELRSPEEIEEEEAFEQLSIAARSYSP